MTVSVCAFFSQGGVIVSPFQSVSVSWNCPIRRNAVYLVDEAPLHWSSNLVLAALSFWWLSLVQFGSAGCLEEGIS